MGGVKLEGVGGRAQGGGDRKRVNELRSRQGREGSGKRGWEDEWKEGW